MRLQVVVFSAALLSLTTMLYSYNSEETPPHSYSGAAETDARMKELELWRTKRDQAIGRGDTQGEQDANAMLKTIWNRPRAQIDMRD